MPKYEKTYLLENSNGGLAYFHHVYPQSVGLETTNKHFKVRDEKTASTNLFLSDGVWLLKDHGSGEALNCIDLCMREENLEFLPALKYLYGFFRLGAEEAIIFKPVREHKATKEDKDYYSIEYHSEIQQPEVVGPYLNNEVAIQYNFKSVKSYQYVSYRKDGNGKSTDKLQLNTVTATDEYPIYAFDEGDFVKIYEPKNVKQYRFRFLGKKPKRHVYGWDRIFNQVDEKEIKRLREIVDGYGSSQKSSAIDAREELDELLLENIIIGSGGSDSLNVASLDVDNYHMVWLNSETEQLTYEEYHRLKSVCKKLYNLPDIDTTGVKQAVKLGLQYLDLKTIWLPNKLLDNNKKDFRDWIGNYKHLGVEKTKNAFEKLKNSVFTLEFRFWEWNKKTGAYKYNYVNLLYFLEHQGFYMFKLKHRNQQKGNNTFIFIKVDGNVAREVSTPEIKSFVIDWLKENHVSMKVLNMVISSQFLNEKGLQSLPCKELDFTTASAKDQLFYFKNKSVKVTAEGIEEVNPAKITNYVWDNKVLNHNIKITAPQFEIFKDKAEDWDIKILEKDNMFFNYLINGSRVHWRNDLEEPFKGKSQQAKEQYHRENRFNIAGPNLTDDEAHEQKLHIINKIYTIGYLLHSYKDDAKPWCVYVMDNKLPEVASESHGGSGKSFGVGKIVEHFKNYFYLEGRNPDLLRNQFLYDGVDEDTDIIFVDDAHYSLNFGHFFSTLTGTLRVNPKHGKSFEIAFKQSPKMLITTNFVPTTLDPSTIRRLQLMVFSDYYHEQTDEYMERRQIIDDFGGKRMFDETFSAKDYNLFYNFCLQCLQFYLGSTQRHEAPEGNVKKRNLMQLMGDNFYEWAKSYFSEDKLNTYIPRKELQDDYKNFVSGRTMSVQKQKKALEAFCQFNEYVFNPKQLLGSDGTIKRALPDYVNGKRQIVEHFYIQTPGAEIEIKADEPEPQEVNTDNVPF
ncbi:primase-helicase family protein [Flavobacterium rakeshii]|uniref:primase-helicase family protein n=1 Tax=Flavobacterium rakeshii TaxID=1038845 RepID=UPI002E7C0981|nr:primase-helicase family protein [Flavobacterium rakeshii]MEE1897104.1 primase-helicase family protein [Flavobacterium rakeshii]